MKIKKINFIKSLRKFKINIFFFILLFLVFANKFDFFLNTYIILKLKLEQCLPLCKPTK